MTKCIICDEINDSKSVEHIIPESFGNKRYVMDKGTICNSCNSRFSRFESKALSNTVFAMERARFGVVTKKGKTSKGKLGDLTITGDDNFREQIVNIEGLNKNNSKDFDPETREFTLKIDSFDKSEVATSKFLLMLGIESLYKSRKELFDQYDFTILKNYLTNKSNEDWGFITNIKNPLVFIDIPKGSMGKYIRKINCQMKFNNEYEDELLFHFKYGGIGMTINLLNRDLTWVDDYKEKYDHINIFPSHLDKKYQKQKNKER